MSRELDKTVAAGEASAPSATLVTGQVFADRYRVEAMVGEGAMGAVYRVRDIKLDEVVALKQLTLDREDALDRFLAEVRLARRVTHPNVARTHDFGESQRTRFLTMEYVEGTALDELVQRRGAMPVGQVVEVGAAIADGLGAAHAAGIVHRDLKPANVMVETTGRVVITDFGIARATSTEDARRTQSIVGTPHYMSPEQLASGPLDGRADIYALGVILFELATGTLPFEGNDAIAVAMARLREAPPDPRTRAAVPDALADLILRCLARDPDARPGSAAEVRQSLIALEPEGTAPTMAITPGSISSPSGLFAPMAPTQRGVAVLPFAYRGAAEHDYLGEGVAEELIDALSRTKGLKVLSLGATRRFAEERDPVAMGRELDVGAVVDGTVQLAGDRVRLSARLVEAVDGEQRWTERFDGRFEDVFVLQESMGRRLAEALRVEITASSERKTATPEAIELYLQARKLLRKDVMVHAEEAVGLLERALADSPDFGLAMAAHAMASVRAWWGELRDADGSRGRRAYDSVQRAIRGAPDLPETHQARAMMAVQEGAFAEAAAALQRTLELAPTMAEAHQYLGSLQVEAGRLTEGRRRLELALELDPTLAICHLVLARAALLAGDEAAHARHDAALDEHGIGMTLPGLISRIRFAAYRQDAAERRRLTTMLRHLGSEPGDRMAMLYSALDGGVLPTDACTLMEEATSWLDNERFAALMKQILVEVMVMLKERDAALALLGDLAQGILIDVVWLERCPLFDAIRDDAAFVEAHRLVAQRARAMWRR